MNLYLGCPTVLLHVVFAFTMLHLSAVRAEDSIPAYRDRHLAAEERVKDLVGRMTVEEKARQLDMYNGCEGFLDKDQWLNWTHAKPDAVLNPQLAEKRFGALGAGSIHDLYPRPKLYNAVQAWLIKSNRLGIPALFIEEGLHGYMAAEQTVFPQSINLATTWNPELARRTGAGIAAEARANGVTMILGPVLDLARDPRWGRGEESFGEDPYLASQMGLAFVQGMQGEALDTDHTVIAEPKHFAGHGSPESGLNTSPLHAGEREVRSVMLKAFEPAIREGKALGVMVAYHDIDGVPCVGNPWLLTQVLREEWGFRGLVLSDLTAIRKLHEKHHVAATPRDAVCQAINAGVDMQFYDFDHAVFQDAIVAGTESGQLSVATLDQAVSRVLRVKFLLGLFENPFVDETLDARVRRSQAHLDLALDVGRQSMCLLKNENGLLPLKKDLKCIAVIGANANCARLGDYSDAATEGAEQGMLQQIKKIVSPQTQVLYSDGGKIEEAVALAKKAEVTILGLGEWTGISGESYDRSDIGLPGEQDALLKAVAATGIPTVLVLQNGRALTIPWAAEHLSSLLEAWYPGELGGRAIAETLFGDNNPAGRLPVSFPRSTGQLPVYYNHYASKGERYIDGDRQPVFAFGHGLSYTTFRYDKLAVAIPPSGSRDDVLVSFEITNTGSRAGDEVAQLYVRQTTASVVTPVMALKAFSRVRLQPGEAKPVTFRLRQTDLAVWGAQRQWKVEPGEYTAMVGGGSVSGLAAKFNLE